MPPMNTSVLQSAHAATLAETLGIRFVEASKDRVLAELTHRAPLTTVGGALHGGTLMALADTVGAAATFLNLPPGASTTTLESKTNFFGAGRAVGRGGAAAAGRAGRRRRRAGLTPVTTDRAQGQGDGEEHRQSLGHVAPPARRFCHRDAKSRLDPRWQKLRAGSLARRMPTRLAA